MSATTIESASSGTQLERVLAFTVQQGLYPSAERLAYYAGWVFRGISLAQRDVLDVGCGYGLIPAYAAACGAAVAVGIEPESDGATAGMRASLDALASQLRLDAVEIYPETLESFAMRQRTFDVISLCQVINHLDEQACMRLHCDPVARRRYRPHFELLRGLLNPGGVLIVTDCGRRNLWRPLTDRGLRHPFAPSIEWEKHQEPELWAALLEQSGFAVRDISWRTPNTLRRLEPLLRNGWAARCLTSEFRLTARRAD
jgi:SAM-dependent methyltransferase